MEKRMDQATPAQPDIQDQPTVRYASLEEALAIAAEIAVEDAELLRLLAE
jgi:hypothetical protein